MIPIDTALLHRIRLSGEIRFRHGNHEALGFLYVDDDDHFTVVAAARDVNGLDALKKLRTVLLMTFAASVFIVSVLGCFDSRRHHQIYNIDPCTRLMVIITVSGSLYLYRCPVSATGKPNTIQRSHAGTPFPGWR